MDGILIINKHKGCTSHDIVHKIKKITKEKVGHTGTLDPMATGVLPLLIGKGTLCSKYFSPKLCFGKSSKFIRNIVFSITANGKSIGEVRA